MNKRIKIAISILTSLVLTGVIIIAWFYLVGLNLLLKSDFAIKQIENFTKSAFNMDLTIIEPNLKTHLKPLFEFQVKNLTLKKGDIVLVQLKDFDSSIQYKIFKKTVKINRLKASTLIVNADKLMENLPENNAQNNRSDWKIDFYSADLRLDDLELTFKQKNNTLLDLYMRDIYLDLSNEQKYLSFNLDALILKDNKVYSEIVSSTLDEIKVYKDNLKIDDLRVLVNNSKLKLDAFIDISTIDLDAQSEVFYLEDIFHLVKSDFIVPNGSELLKPLENPKGNVNFKVNYKNGDLSGIVNVNNTSAKLKDVNLIPINISTGKIIITKDKVKFDKLEGFWGKNKKNIVKIEGDIKDYYKTFDSNIVIDTVINNEFLQDYLAPLIGNTKLVISHACNTRVIYKAKNNIMNIVWLAKLPKGVLFGSDYQKTDISDYDRFIKGDFEIIGDNFNIKNINYYIAPDMKRGIKMTPVFILDAKMKLNGALKEAGFSFGREMPCEILNVFMRDNIFKKGTIKGNAHLIYVKDKAYLDSDMELKNTLIPSQRLFIKNAKLSSTPEYIYLNSKGGFKRAKYELKAKIVNKMTTPVILKNLTLHIDNIDIERFLTVMNADNNEIDNKKAQQAETIVDDNYMFDTNLLRIEEADFTLDKGNYKEITFGNIKAKMSLDDKGILKLSSNRFDFAKGYSSLKSECDLVNLKYNVKLGAKDIDSDLLARVLFNLNKEITGKASGIIELNTDKSAKLNGTMKFIIKEGTIGKIGLVEYLLKIASLFRNPIVMINPAIIMDIVSVPEGKFEKITGSLDIKDNIVKNINIKSYSKSLSALIKGRFDMERHDASLRIYTRFSSEKKSIFNFLRNISLNTLANKVKLRTRNDSNYYSSELKELPSIETNDDKAQVFLTQIEGDIEHNNFLSNLKKLK
ncbi:MAG: hypothetical protein IJ877_07245 [Candidatus Gastranaerophilales bacterium]|nr:hypothetical protein [Candidatus Gastranaerophilales bacterium]